MIVKNNISVAVIIFIAMCLTSCGSQRNAVNPIPNTEECAVLDFQYSTNITVEESRDISGVFRVNFHPAKYILTDVDRVDTMLESRNYKNKKLTKQQICEVGRGLGVKYVVTGSINKLMDEYSVDVQVINVLKETTIAFEGGAFQKQDYSKEVSSIAGKLASKVE